MAVNNDLRGIDDNIKPRVFRRDHRSMGEKFNDFLEEPSGFLTITGSLCATMIVFPAIGELLFLITLFFIWRFSAVKFRLPFRMPQTSGFLDYGQPDPSGKPSPAEGIGFFGNEKGTKKELWFNNSDLRTHILIFGSTGAGKALKMDEWIAMADGTFVENKDIKVGDMVLGPMGKPTEVIGVYPQGMCELYRVTLEDGRFVDVSKDHLWEVQSEAFDLIRMPDGKYANARVMQTNVLAEVLSITAGLPLDRKMPYYLPGHELCSFGNRSQIRADLISLACYVNEETSYFFNDKKVMCEMKNTLDKEVVSNFKHMRKWEQLDVVKKSLLGFTSSLYRFGAKIEFTSFALVGEELIVHLAIDLPYFVDILREVKNIKQNTPFTEYKGYLSKVNVGEDEIFEGLSAITKKPTRIISVERLNEKAECQCIKVQDARGLFLTRDYIVTHNTETLLSLSYNALVQGSGLIYIDGKGENVLYTKIFAMARTMGREDDVLVINYMTGARDVFGPQEKKLSNTLNPFAAGGSGGLSEMLSSLMDTGGGGNSGMWEGRAISLMSALMMALVFLRDKGKLLLDVSAIRQYLVLDEIIKLAQNEDICKEAPHIKEALDGYLFSIPGYNKEAAKNGEPQEATALEQHGYLQMQFTKILGSLADVYGFIYKTNLGEVDFKDVVLNRRILVVLLPALEKSPVELQNLGKIIIACVKQMMGAALGATIEGSYAEVVDTKPTTAPMPFTTVFDEYGYYAVKGSAVMPAQARSIGFSMIFAGQDLPAFKKASPEEAASIVANCNVKICMKLEDPEETFKLFDLAAGEALSADVNNMEYSSGALGSSFVPSRSVALSTKKRINVLDLKDQDAGEAHILFKSALVRAKMFYAAPPKPPQIRVNYFVKVEPLDSNLVKAINDNDSKVTKIFERFAREEPFSDIIMKGYSGDMMTNQFIETVAKTKVEDKKHLSLDEWAKWVVASGIDFEESMKREERRKSFGVGKMDFSDAREEWDDEDGEFIDKQKLQKDLASISMKLDPEMSEEEVAQSAQDMVEESRKASAYPPDETPEPKSAEEIKDILTELDAILQESDEDEDEDEDDTDEFGDETEDGGY